MSLRVDGVLGDTTDTASTQRDDPIRTIAVAVPNRMFDLGRQHSVRVA